jgi:hypothetical protein
VTVLLVAPFVSLVAWSLRAWRNRPQPSTSAAHPIPGRIRLPAAPRVRAPTALADHAERRAVQVVQ